MVGEGGGGGDRVRWGRGAHKLLCIWRGRPVAPGIVWSSRRRFVQSVPEPLAAGGRCPYPLTP